MDDIHEVLTFGDGTPAAQTLTNEQGQLHTTPEEMAKQVSEGNKKLTQTTHPLQQQAPWQALFDHALEAILIADDMGHYLDANPAACKLLGMKRENLLEHTIADFADPNIDMAEVWQQFLEQGQMSGEFRLYLPDGQVRDTDFNAVANYVPGQHLSIMRDISEQKQLEAEHQRTEVALDQSKAQVSRILDNAGAAIGEFSAYPDYTYVHGLMSVGCEAVYGYSQAEMTGDTELWQSRVVPEDMAAVIIPAYEQIFAGKSFSIEYRFRDKTDTIRWIAETLTSQWDKAAGCWQVTTVAIDISDRKQAELALQQSEAKNRAILAALPDLIIRLSAEGLYREVFASSCKFDVISVNAIGQSIFDVVPTAMAEQTYFYLQRALQTGELQVFEQEVPIGNHLQYEEVRVVKSADDEVLLVIRNISEQKRIEAERKQAEQALQGSEQRLQAILDHAPIAIYIVDLQNRHLLINPSYAAALCTTPDNVVGKSLYDIWPPEVADRFAAQNRHILETGQLLQVEEAVPLSDGLHSYITVKFPLYDTAGNLYATCGISTDITERKTLETQFYQAQRLESLGTLAGGIAHDLNNILAPILTTAQLLRLSQKGLDAKGQELVNLLENSAKRGTGLVKQILAVTRTSQGKHTAVDLAALMQDELEIILHSLPKSIEIKTDISCSEPTQPTPSMIWADPTYLHQIILNLCVNARDAMAEGGTLTLSATQVFVDEAMAARNLEAQVGNYAMITVADTGSGIPPEVQERMFDPFFTTKALGQGTGLGLATVRGLVKANHGFIQVFSEVGQGTQFKIYFPLMEGATAEPEPSQPTSDLSPGHQAAFVAVEKDELYPEVQRNEPPRH